MAEIAETMSITRRRLVLRDSLAFLSLIAIIIALFAVTLLLFRSFMAHRVDLAHRWADRGRTALVEGHPQQAVAAYRAALSYAPDEHGYEVTLAQALADAGHTEEAYNYYIELWDLHPGDGTLNLQLAHLAAAKRDVQAAINFYRASLYGTWEGDGVERRREVRLELARYLIAEHQLGPARAELLVAGGNSPDMPEIDLTLATLLLQADAPADALSFYQKAIALDPKNARALAGAGYLSYMMGDYAGAHKLLERAVHGAQDKDIDPSLLANSARILQLQPSDALPASALVPRILTLRGIAKKRLEDCIAEFAAKPTLPETLHALETRWAGSDGTTSRGVLLRDADRQHATVQLVYDTELTTSQTPCSPATGDDALVLLLARQAAAQEASHR